MENNKQTVRMVLYPILYWIIFIIIPFIIVYNTRDYNRALNIPGVIMFYILFIAPFLYFIPYKLVKTMDLRQKLVFILAGLVTPYIIFYVYIINQTINTFNNSRFPF